MTYGDKEINKEIEDTKGSFFYIAVLFLELLGWLIFFGKKFALDRRGSRSLTPAIYQRHLCYSK